MQSKLSATHLAAVICIFLGASRAFAGPPDCSPDDTACHIQNLKNQILEIAQKAQGTYDGGDNDPAVHEQLQPLVDTLVGIAPKRSEVEKVEASLGAWQQIWSDGPSGAPSSGPLASSIYEVVSRDGHYWYIAQEINAGVTTTGFMRGEFELRENDLAIHLTKAVFKSAWIGKDADLGAWADQAEMGMFDSHPQTFPPGRSPIGKPGSMDNVYVDADFRIVQGGMAESGRNDYLYVLVRTARTTR